MESDVRRGPGTHTYILSKCYTGTSKADMQLDVRQMVQNGEYEIENPVAYIAADMFHVLSEYLDTRYKADTIRKALEDTELSGGMLGVYDPTGTVQKIVIKADREHGRYGYQVFGRTPVQQEYHVRQIDAADVGYLVSEHILLPQPYVPLAERIYHTVFTDIKSAIRYRDSKMRSYSHEKGVDGSGWRIVVVDVNEIEKDAYYRANLKAASDIKLYGLDPSEYRYIADLNELQEVILADGYDDLRTDQKDDVNYDIYQRVRDFISEDYVDMLDADVDGCEFGQGELEGIANTALILAIVNPDAPPDIIDQVKAVLKHHDYRLGTLTDDIYNAHPDEGFILVARDGDMSWYTDVAYVNTWEGNIDNPWFGKFQPNENDVLLCFKEYHPELIVDRLPKDEELQALKAKYLTSLAEKRSRHDEMKREMFEDDNGNTVEVCVGNWYCDGVSGMRHYDDIHFVPVYGSYAFTDDECRRLLSGEEVIIERFMSKSGRETKARGKLKDCSTAFDRELVIAFTRTDISATNRRRMDMDAALFGMEDNSEPGLPSEGDGDDGDI